MILMWVMYLNIATTKQPRILIQKIHLISSFLRVYSNASTMPWLRIIRDLRIVGAITEFATPIGVLGA